jgi:3-dehydroquinate dehydratase-1
MDKMGSYTRIIGPLLGSPVTYATITTQSAPGQFDIKTTSEIIKKLKN